MGYSDIEKMREYQREWMANRRSQFFSDKACAHCGSVEKMELHHLDPNQKEDHRIWSWSEERRNKEISKCMVLCFDCHRNVHGRGIIRHGTRSGYAAKCRCAPCVVANSEYKRAYRTRTM